MQLSSLKRLLARDEALLGSVIVSFLVRVISAAVAFGMNIAIARLLGVDESGIYFLSLTLITAASVFARFGMDHALMRFISPVWKQGEVAGVVATAVKGLGVVSLIGLIASIILYLGAGWLSDVLFSEPGLAGVLKIMAFALTPFSLMWVLSGILKAVNQPAKANYIEAGAIPTIVSGVMVTLLLLGAGGTSVTAAEAFTVASMFTVALGLYFFVQTVSSGEATIRVGGEPFRQVINSAYPLMWVGVLNFTIVWSSSLFLGIYADASDVSLYNVAHRTASLIAFVLIVFNSISAPRFAALYSHGELDKLEGLALKTASHMVLFALPMLVAILLFSDTIMLIFGEDFTAASTLLIVIALGQFVNVATGSVGYILMMTGHENQARNNTLFIAVLSVVLNFVLVSRYGAMGAALTTAICLAMQNVIASILVYRNLGIVTAPGLSWLRSKRKAQL